MIFVFFMKILLVISKYVFNNFCSFFAHGDSIKYNRRKNFAVTFIVKSTSLVILDNAIVK